MKYNSKLISDLQNDWFILSKGHGALAQYVTLAEAGFFSYNKLEENFLKNGGIFGGHPDKLIQYGIEISSGSLGHGLSIGAGVAIAAKKDKKNRKAFVLLGDGELNEGMVWEAVMFSGHHKLDNLIAIIDYNGLQGFGTTNNVLDLEPLDEKFKSFNWEVKKIDGHNMQDILNTFNNLPFNRNKPNVIIAKTIKGKGVKSMENKLSSHYEVLSEQRFKELLKELENN